MILRLLLLSKLFPAERDLGSHVVPTLGGSAHFFGFWLHFWSILALILLPWLYIPAFLVVCRLLFFCEICLLELLGFVFLNCLVAKLLDYWVVGWLFFGVVGLFKPATQQLVVYCLFF